MLERPAVRLVAEPKAGGVRWLARLDGRVAREYAAAVVPLVPTIETALPSEVVANRVERCEVDPVAIHLEPWRAARERFRALIRERTDGARAALVTDVRDCYGSIEAVAVEGALRRLDAPFERVRAVRGALCRMHAEGVRGLPIGPEPSAVLANAVLLSVDRRLRREGWRHVRWVDDFVILLPDPAEAPGVLEVLRHELADVGLELSPQKTRVLLDPTVIAGAAAGAISRPRGPATAPSG